MMMHAGLGIRLNRDRAGPDLLGPDTGVIDRSLTEHAWRLGGVGIEPVALDHPHAIVLPGRCIVMRMVMVLVVVMMSAHCPVRP